MAGNVIDIVIKATDQTGGSLNKINSAFQSLTGFSLSAAGGVAAAGVAFKKLYQFLKQSVDETEKYVTSITDMSRVLGINTEETSRLVQAADDLFITQDKLNTAMLAASRQGIDVSINGLKNLSTEYLSLNVGAERAQFLMKTFGRSGADMGKMMEVGADGIDAATKAIADNLIVTAESQRQIIQYKQAVDGLNDAWTGFKLTTGNKIIPALTAVLELINKNKDETEGMRNKLVFLMTTMEMSPALISKLTGFTEDQIKAFMDLGTSIDNAGNSMSAFDEMTKITLPAFQKFITATHQASLSLAGEFTSAEETLTRGMEGVNEAIADSQKNLDYWTEVVARAPSQVKELTAKVEALEAAGDTSSKTYKDAKEKLEDWNNTLSHGPGYLSTLKDKLGENEQKVKDLQAAYERETNQVILGYLQQKAMADGVLTNDEMQWLLEKGVEWGIYSETAINKMKLVQAEWENWTPTNKGATFTVTTKAIGNGTVVNNGNGISMEAKAGGGPVSGNTPYIVGESGPEMFIPNGGGKIVPNSQLGGGVSTISEASIMHLAKVIASEMQKVSG